MNKFVLLALLATIISCTPTENKSAIEYPYTLIDYKEETTGGNTNTMEHLTSTGELNLDTLKLYCIDRKKQMNSGLFNYLVFFDSKDNAVFPNTPFTAEYGMDEEPQKHIQAIYTYNTVNGYSQLTFYENNRWDSSPQTFEIQ